MRYLILAIGLSMAVCGLSIGVTELQAQPYPSRPIEIVVPNDAG